MTDEQKREFERLFNHYSLQTFYYPEFLSSYRDCMRTLRIAVVILGYAFEHDSVIAERDGVKYYSYKLRKSKYDFFS